MLRISVTQSSENAVTLLLEGKVMDRTIEQLKESCDQALSRNQRLTLDLSGVSFVNRKAIAVLQQLLASEVTMVNCSGFVAEQLKAEESSSSASKQNGETLGDHKSKRKGEM
jgi:ABC-type transporter Mla MlaB component